MEDTGVPRVERSMPEPLPTLSPAVPPYVTLGLTVVYTVFYSLLFIFIYAQLWLVLRYRHKRLSYQTVFLFLCLLWSALRTVLFSFYFRNFVTANTLGAFPFWLLYCFPVCLQFFTLCLMNLYFAQQLWLKSKSVSFSWSFFFYVLWMSARVFHLLIHRMPLYLLFLLISLLFLVVNLVCALLVRMSLCGSQLLPRITIFFVHTQWSTWWIFVFKSMCYAATPTFLTSTSLFDVSFPNVNPLCVQGTSVCQVTVIGAIVILLYASRACYNLVVLAMSNKRINSFDYDWYNVSDQADLQSTLGDTGYIVFGVILFVWELLPTRLSSSSQSPPANPRQGEPVTHTSVSQPKGQGPLECFTRWFIKC
uniref:Uncharacterized protein n=1 Tax=Gouania willdenowi TaxID=441366 RepID=A0A8C5GL08_GOUWI